MDKYDRVAKVKLVELIRLTGFLSIESIGEYKITLVFDDSKCTLDTFGRVIWAHDE